MSRTRNRGGLSHHATSHHADPGKALDQLYDKVILGVLLLSGFIALLVYLSQR